MSTTVITELAMQQMCVRGSLALYTLGDVDDSHEARVIPEGQQLGVVLVLPRTATCRGRQQLHLTPVVAVLVSS